MGSHIRSATGLGCSRGSLLCLPHSGASLAGVGPPVSPEDITMVMRKHSLRPRTAKAGWGSPDLKKAQPFASQILGHPDITGTHGRDEDICIYNYSLFDTLLNEYEPISFPDIGPRL